MVVLGVDLRSSEQHESSIASISPQSLSLESIQSFKTDGDLLAIINESKPQLVALGTPLSLPNGMCCLDQKCACESDNRERKGRQCEIELAQMGISCFFTSKGSIISRLIYRGMKIRQDIEELGFEVVEVYPYASKVVLFGDSVPPKHNPASIKFMKEKLPSLINGLEGYLDDIDINGCDAILNSYTAVLHFSQATDLVGAEPEGLLAIPRLL